MTHLQKTGTGFLVRVFGTGFWGLFINVAYPRNLSYDFRKPYTKEIVYVIHESVRTYELRKFGRKYTHAYYLSYNLRKVRM